jgi:hypothetical protein
MKQQTAVEWLNEVLISKGIFFEYDILQEAKQMEMEKAIRDYNAGYDDAKCNHINDAENYVSERKYMNDK